MFTRLFENITIEQVLEANKLFETTYNVDLNLPKIDYPTATKPTINTADKNRLTNLVLDVDETGSWKIGEKISEILLGAPNLNYFNLSYPFVDLKVNKPVPNISEKDEYISVKTCRTANTLIGAFSEVNGFTFRSFLNFFIELVKMKVFKSDMFKNRNAYENHVIITMYFTEIMNKYDKMSTSYAVLFASVPIFMAKLQKFMEYEWKTTKIFYDKNDFEAFFHNLFVPVKNGGLGWDEELIKNFKTNLKNWDLFIKDSTIFPPNLYKTKISWALIYFDTPVKTSDRFVLNLRKCDPIKIFDLYRKSAEIWVRKKYYMDELKISSKTGKAIKSKNIYFKHVDIAEILGYKNINAAFPIHIKVTLQNVEEFKYRAGLLPKKGTEIAVDVINNVKGLMYNANGRHLNKYFNILADVVLKQDPKIQHKIVKNFSDFLDELKIKYDLEY